MNRLLSPLLAVILLLSSATMAQTGVFNAADPVVAYDPSHPPAIPPVNTVVKGVRTRIAFRLKFPAGYAATAKGHAVWEYAWREPDYFPFLLKAHK